MNQDQVKERLLKLHECKEDFTLIFSGKKSKKVNGLYKPDTREIIIHNKNFLDRDGASENEDLLFYTAMHELAHHIQFTEYHQKSARSHTAFFYSILDDLADIAETNGLYKIAIDDDTQKLIDQAKDISCEIAKLQKQLGAALLKLNAACENKGVRFEDVVERKTQISRQTMKKAGKIYNMDLPSEIGADIQEAAAKERDDEKRNAIVYAGERGKSVVQAKRSTAAPVEEEDSTVTLMKEKQRLERTIQALNRRLEEVSEQLNSRGELDFESERSESR